MNTQPINQKDPQSNVELRIRTLRTLWIALVLTVVGYYVFTLFTGRLRDITPNPTMSLVLLAIGVLITLISFPIKSKLLGSAIQQQQVALVQQAYIVTWALTEVPALLGMLDFYLTGHRQYYLLLIIAALGQLLHFPRREHVIDASFKSPIL